MGLKKLVFQGCRMASLVVPNAHIVVTGLEDCPHPFFFATNLTGRSELIDGYSKSIRLEILVFKFSNDGLLGHRNFSSQFPKVPLNVKISEPFEVLADLVRLETVNVENVDVPVFIEPDYDYRRVVRLFCQAKCEVNSCEYINLFASYEDLPMFNFDHLSVIVLESASVDAGLFSDVRVVVVLRIKLGLIEVLRLLTGQLGGVESKPLTVVPLGSRQKEFSCTVAFILHLALEVLEYGACFYKLPVLVEYLFVHLHPGGVHVVRVVASPHYPLSGSGVLNGRQQGVLILGLGSPLFRIGVVWNHHVIQHRYITVPTDDVRGQAHCEDRGVTDPLFLTERVVYANRADGPFLSLTLIRVYHLRPVAPVDRRRQDRLE